MARQHALYCETCRERLPLGVLVARRPDLGDMQDLQEFAPELAAIIAFMSAHVTYDAIRRHVVLVVDDETPVIWSSAYVRNDSTTHDEAGCAFA